MFGARHRPQLNVLARKLLHVRLRADLDGKGAKGLLSNPYKCAVEEQKNWQYVKKTAIRFSDLEWANNRLTNT